MSRKAEEAFELLTAVRPAGSSPFGELADNSLFNFARSSSTDELSSNANCKSQTAFALNIEMILLALI